MEILVLCLLFAAACKRDKGAVDQAYGNYRQPQNYAEKLADSLYRYAKQIYYWNDLIPNMASFDPYKYAIPNDELTGIKNELLAVTLSTTGANGKPYELTTQYESGTYTDNYSKSKYSYAILTADLYGGGASANIIADPNQVADMKMTLDGKENELGFHYGFAQVSYLTGTPKALPQAPTDSVVTMIQWVTKESPAWNAGLRRGDLIANVNGTNWNYKNNAEQIFNTSKGSNITLTTYDPATNISTEKKFNKTLYTYNPLYKDTVIQAGANKIAYVAYKSFTIGTNTEPVLKAAFEKFAASNVTHLVIDLRYNGGGYVSSAAYFANTILSNSTNGDVLFKEYYNKTMQDGKADMLKNQPVYINNEKKDFTYYDLNYTVDRNTTKINKVGTFNASGNIKSVYFIVSRNTASASELLINSVKPYFSKVVLINAPFSKIDDPNYTYGKPIGFFEIRIGKYSVYMSNFETKNKNNEGGYYRGMRTDIASGDDIVYELGDPKEGAFASAIKEISPSYSLSTITTAPRSVRPGSASRLGIASGGAPTKIYDMIKTPEPNR